MIKRIQVHSDRQPFCRAYPTGCRHLTHPLAALAVAALLTAPGTHAATTVVAWGSNAAGQTAVPPGLSNVVAVAGGGSHSLALRADGAVAAWGLNNYGQTNVPVGLSNVVGVAGGGYHSLALRADGTVTAWGQNTYNQSNVPAGLGNVVAVAAGGYQSLALRADGTVAAWGLNAYGLTNVAAGLSNVVGVAGGWAHCLALRTDGTVVAWGYNSYGQTNVPAGLSNVVAVAAGDSQSLALRANGTVVAWGNNTYGQTNVPAGLSNMVTLAGGYYHSIALRADGTLATWGNNSSGVMAVPAGLSNVMTIAAGEFHNLALTGTAQPAMAIGPQPLNRGAAVGETVTLLSAAIGQPTLHYQWQFNGTNISGANGSVLNFNMQANSLGSYMVIVTNDFGALTNPVAVLSPNPALAFTQPVGLVTSVDATLNGMVSSRGWPATAWFEWGTNNMYGFVTSPQALGTGSGVVRVSAPISGLVAGAIYHFRMVASNFVGAITYGADGQFTTGMKVTAWGDSSSGNVRVPPGLTNIMTIACGHGHSLAIRSDGTVVAWGGAGSYFRAGQTNVPDGLSNVVAIAGGFAQSLAVREDGTVAAWGRFLTGQPSTVPVGLSNVVAVAAGDSHCLALRADGTIRVWGNNSYGQTNVLTGLTNVVAISAGASHSLALKADGTVAAWGDNSYGQATVPSGLQGVVAISSEVWHNLALKSNGTVVAWGYGSGVVPAGLSNLVEVADGQNHSSALKSDGSVVVWGDNSYGQTNLPPGLSNVVAVASGDLHCLALGPNLPPQVTSQTVAGPINQSFPVTLRGLDPNGDPISFRIVSLPAAGTLYQYLTNGLGNPITGVDSPVNDPLGRIFFAPAPDQFGVPYTPFNIVANDGQYDSPLGSVTVNVLPSPVLNPAGAAQATNGTFALSFAGFSSITYSVWASTNLSNWTLLGSATQPTLGQFQFTDTTATNWMSRYYRVSSP